MSYGLRADEVGAHLPARDPDPELAASIKYNGKPYRGRSANFALLTTPRGFNVHIQGHVPLLLDRNDPANQREGLEKRLLQRLPDPEPDLMCRFKSFVSKWLDKHCSPLERIPEFEEWLGHAPYPEHRRVELRRVHQSLNGGLPTKGQRQKVSSFPKVESYPEYKYLRWINSRSDHVKVTVGPAFHAIEGYLFSMPYFAKRFKAPGELAAHIRDAPKALNWASSDYTAFESHMRVAMMDACELQLYDRMLSNFPRISRFIRTTIGGTNRLSTRAGVRVTIRGRRMSGDMCTSLGNSFTNLMIALFVSFESGDPDPWVIVEGDDALVGTTCPVDEALFERLGLKIKWQKEEDPCEAGFCGKIFGPSGQVIRDPRKVCQTLGWSDRGLNASPKIQEQLLRAKALSLAYETPHCPIVRALADLVLRNTQGAVPRYVTDAYHAAGPADETSVPAFDPQPDTRALFCKKYGILPSTQVEYEEEIRSGNFQGLSYLFWPHLHQLHQETVAVG